MWKLKKTVGMMIQSSVKDDEQMMGRGLVDATNL